VERPQDDRPWARAGDALVFLPARARVGNAEETSVNVEEISIEDQLANFILRPQPEKRYCEYGKGICRTVLSQHNPGTMCFRHEAKDAAERRSKRVADKTGALTAETRLCSTPNCPSVLWEENKSGICTKCRSKLAKRVSDTAAAAAARPSAAIDPALQVEAATATLDDFIVQLKEENNQEEERTLVTEEMTKADDVRVCAVEGCDKALASYNRSGRCGDHCCLSRGMKLKDGSIPRPLVAEIAAKVAAMPSTQKPEKPLDELNTCEIRAIVVAEQKVALHIPVQALDGFWAKLAIEDKTRIVEREISGAW
jgi:hypothetical protein